MLGAVLDLHLSKFDNEVARDIRDNISFDNILSGYNSEEDLLLYYKQFRSLMSQAKFNLRVWATNSDQLKDVTRRDKPSDPNTAVGLLGLRWNTATNMISLSTRQLPRRMSYKPHLRSLAH